MYITTRHLKNYNPDTFSLICPVHLGCGCFMEEKRKTTKGMRSERVEMVTAKMGERGFLAVDGGTAFTR